MQNNRFYGDNILLILVLVNMIIHLKQQIMNSIDFYKHKLAFEIDSADLHLLMRSDEIKNVVIIDTRLIEAFEKEHIINAINLPNREVSNDTLNKLDKDKLYITYCSGIGCNGSTKGAIKLAEAGFKVKELIGGISCWIEEGYETEGIMQNRKTIINCGCQNNY